MSQSKSTIGHKPSIAKAPPRLPDGREWWCTPPIAAPSPEHIAYVEGFLAEITTMTVDKSIRPNKGALVDKVQRWLKEARALRDKRIAHEENRPPSDAMTTEELLIQSDRIVGKLFDFMKDAGYEHRLTAEMRAVASQLNRKARAAMNRRIALPSHPVRRIESRTP